jgi:wyosine [tRNA(Phe)-imidazoG37] synthetase (radical SAM superfamily)
VDVTTPPKKCTYNCIYRQLGHTKRHVTSPEEIQSEMPSSEEIISEVEETLSRLDRGIVDVLTFSGTGEPTLNPNIGLIVSGIRRIAQDLPIVLLTNASLLPREDIRKGILEFDIVTAKFDAGDEDTFKRINHPSKGSFKLHEIKDAVKKLGTEMKGMLALEVMLLRGPRGFTNVKGLPKRTLIDGILDINPDLVQLYTPWRPVPVSAVRPVSTKALRGFGAALEQHLSPDKLWIYGVHDARGRTVVWKTRRALEGEILSLLRRRPCRAVDVSHSLGIMSAAAASTLEKLRKSNDITKNEVGTDVFYRAEG